MRGFLMAAFALVMAFSFMAISAPAPTRAFSDVATAGHPSRVNQALRIEKAARSHLGRRFRMGATGPKRFDCSGLVFRVYKETGLVSKIGGSRMGATAYYSWFHKRGLVSRSNPSEGDLIVWGKHGRIKHIGIYIGRGMAISSLVQPWGVSVHPVVGWLNHMHLIAYLHVKLTRS